MFRFYQCKIIILFFILSILTSSALSQVPTNPNKEDEISQKIENLASNVEHKLDYTDMIDELKYLQQNPINLNNTSEEELKKLFFLNDIQINSFLEYINKYGEIVSIYELQAIDGFDQSLISKIMPYITISKVKRQYKIIPKYVLKYGRNQFLVRYAQVLEKQKGYLPIEDSLYKANPNSRYLGSPDKIYARYSFNYHNKVRWGITAEKDPGEEFFKNKNKDFLEIKQNNGFDFYSAYLYLKDLGKIKNLAIGDYHLQFGQGLTMWSSLAFGKSFDAVNIKRYAQGIKPNTSVNENKFMRGIATTIDIKNYEISVFYSHKKIDANITDIDSVSNNILFISSLQETGFHRTPNEIADKNSITETVYGANISYKNKNIKLGATAFKTMYDAELRKRISPYNQFDFMGKENINMGFNYSYLFRNINFYGEVARSDNGGMAYLNGMLASLNPRFSLAMIYRNYGKNYQNLFSNAFSENSRNANEKALYTGIIANLNRKLTLYAFIDNFAFPWLKFSVDAPSKGNDYLAQLEYDLSRKIRMYFRFREKNKQINNTQKENVINYLDNTKKQNFRYYISYSVLPSIILKNTIEYVNYKVADNKAHNGYLIYQDVLYRPLEKPYSFSLRYALFDTYSYDERIYSYESDILYAFSIPSYCYKGSRFYFLVHYIISKNFDFWLRYSQSYYSNKNTIGSGLDEIDGRLKSDIKMQLRIKI